MNSLEEEIEFLKQNAEAGKTPGFKIGRAVAFAVFLIIIYAGLRAAFDAPWLPVPIGFQFSGLYFDLLNYLIWGIVALFPIGLFLGRNYFFDITKTKGTILLEKIWLGAAISIITLFFVFAAFFLNDHQTHWAARLSKSTDTMSVATDIIIMKTAATLIGSTVLILFANAWLIIGEIIQKSWLGYFAAGAYFSAPISAFLFDAPWHPWLVFITLFGAIPAIVLSVKSNKAEV